VRVGSVDGEVEVSVRDDGVGFDTALPRSSAHGLLGMRYRLETEGGQLTLDSAPGRGTVVRARLPESGG
jgi:signal transduction histidine kinase